MVDRRSWGMWGGPPFPPQLTGAWALRGKPTSIKGRHSDPQLHHCNLRSGRLELHFAYLFSEGARKPFHSRIHGYGS